MCQSPDYPRGYASIRLRGRRYHRGAVGQPHGSSQTRAVANAGSISSSRTRPSTTTFRARMTVYSEAMPARQGKRPTHRTPRCDKPLGRVKSFRTSQHRRRALTGLAREARVTSVARSHRGVRGSMHREPREVNPSRFPVLIGKAPVRALDRHPIPQDHRSSVGRLHGLHRDGRCSTRFAKCQLCRFHPHPTLASNVRQRLGKSSSCGGLHAARQAAAPVRQCMKQDESSGAVRRVALLGNHLPRRCGIATFTADLADAISATFPGIDCGVIGMNDAGKRHAYGDRVLFRARTAS